MAVTTNPTRQLVRQQLIESIWNFEGKRIYLVHDGSGELCNIKYDDFGIEEIKISANASNMNAFAERFIGSVRREVFDWFILFNEIQIRNILVEYIGYYNEKRPHQGIAQKVPKGYTPEKALLDFFYLGPAKSKLFVSLPELELPKGFSIKTAEQIIQGIESTSRRALIEKKFKELIN